MVEKWLHDRGETSCSGKIFPLKFTEEQMVWLRMIKDHIISSVHIEKDDLDYVPFDGNGGIGKMYQLFGDEMEPIIDEMNETLAA